MVHLKFFSTVLPLWGDVKNFYDKWADHIFTPNIHTKVPKITDSDMMERVCSRAYFMAAIFGRPFRIDDDADRKANFGTINLVQVKQVFGSHLS